MLTEETNELLTRTGPGTPMGNLLRRYWVPALTADELPEPDCPPVQVQIMSERLIAFRDSAGRVGLIAENCPHRRASLWFGRNEENGLRCVYHGWKFDVSGQCVDMPSEPARSNFKDKVQTTAYPCREFGGVIWTYMGPPEDEPALPPFGFGFVGDDQRMVSRYHHENNFFQGLEGAIDSSHISFLHRRVNPNPTEMQKVTYRFGNPKFEVAKTAYGMVIGAKRETPEPDQVYWRISQYVMPWYSMIPPIALKSSPTDEGQIVSWVPIDDENSVAWRFTWYPDGPIDKANPRRSHPARVPGTITPVVNRTNNYMLDRAVQKSRASFTGIPNIPAEDQAMAESQGGIASRNLERLGTSDTAIIVARRMLVDAAQGLEDGKTPPALDVGELNIRAASVMLPEGVPFQEGAKEFLVRTHEPLAPTP